MPKKALAEVDASAVVPATAATMRKRLALVMIRTLLISYV
jgi:hypothetical protein